MFIRSAGSEFQTLGVQECESAPTKSFETGYRDFEKLFKRELKKTGWLIDSNIRDRYRYGVLESGGG